VSDTTPAPRVVVTGLGAITPQGGSIEEFWDGVVAGRSVIRPVQHMSMEGIRTEIAGEVQVDFAPEHQYLQPGGFHDRALDFTVRAAEEAMSNCGIGVGPIPAERWGVVFGTCNAGLLAGREWYWRREQDQEQEPALVLLVSPQAFSEALSGAFGLKGPVLSVDTACAASANAIGYASALIRSGQADAVLTGGADALSDILVSGFNSLESLSPKPAAPYSIDRSGLSLGEGSAMMVLMREDLAREHGAHVHAELLGYGLSADGYHPTAPHPEGRGAARAIQTALAQGGVSPGEVDYVNSHGTGTDKNDTAETAATKVGLGDAAAYRASVSSTKSMIGHLLGGAGAAEGVITVKAVEDQIVPPTANFTEPDPACDLDYTPNTAREREISVALSNNFAFGGANASVLYARAGARAEGPPVASADRILVTGLAALTPAGTDLAGLWEAYASGRDCTIEEDGIRLGRVELSAGDFMAPKERKRVDRLGLFAVIGSRLALRDAGLELTDENRTRVGVIIGTGVGPMESMEAFAAPVVMEGPASANPAVFPNTVYNAAGGQVAIKIGALGSASTLTAGHGAGASALCYGYDLARTDHADAMICVGADTLTEAVIDGYRGLGVLAGNGGGGFALAEAGVAVVLERAAAAQARGATAYAEVVGCGITSDAVGIGQIDPEGEGIGRAMELAMEQAGLAPQDIVAVWSAKSGLELADAAEAAAIARVFGDASPRVLTPKLTLGEPMGAASTLGLAIALTGWREGHVDESPKGPILVNGMSLGGTNFSIALVPA
jgi:3-oxoacyl-[acyl-carrier-protein] synthase II